MRTRHIGRATASRTLLLVTAAAVTALFPAPAGTWNRSEIEWRTVRTDHFAIHYHPGEEWSAEQTALIAEEIYGPVTDFYCYRPSTIHINLLDVSDEPEGATYYYLNRIDLSASDIEFHLRGTADWLRNVITHEFTHMVSIQSAMKAPRRIPSLYFQIISFEREKRPDVITGYPNFQASVPIAGEVVPNWFAEGTAQFQCGAARHDFWDSHRDMILRVAALNDRLLTLDEMGVFGKNSLGAEQVYNQGFSMVLFIADRFGPDALAALMDELSSPRFWTFNGACRKVLGVAEDDLYRSWRDDVVGRARAVEARIAGSLRQGERVAGRGFLNLFPRRDRRSGGTLFLSNRGGDYSDLALVRVDPSGKETVLDEGVTSRFDRSPAGDAVCYSKRTTDNEHGYSVNDIFVSGGGRDRAKRLTRGLRATDPAWSPDGRRIVCVANDDGTDRLAIIDVETGTHVLLTRRVPGRQYFGLSWGPRGILSARFDGLSRDIVRIDPEAGGEIAVIESAADERDPAWDGTGTGFFYASDRSGIFNIYHRDDALGGDVQVTDVIGGAFNPSPDGSECLFSAYGPDGYEIRRTTDWRSVSAAVDGARDDRDLIERRERCIGGAAVSPTAADAAGGAAETRRRIAEQISAGGEPYRIDYTSLFLFPTFMIYDGSPRIGLSLDSRDMLDRQSVFAGGSIALENTEFDLYLSFESRQFKPTLEFDIFRSRKFYSFLTKVTADDRERTTDLYTRYDLWDAFFTCRFELHRPTAWSRNEISLQYNHGEYGLNIDALDVFGVEVGWTYYKGNEVSLLYDYRSVRPERDADINPRRGRDLHLELTRAFDKLSSGEFEYAFMPVYGKNYFGRYRVRYEEFLPLFFARHALSLMVAGGALDDVNVDDFFYLYLGGRDGLRGYSYYSMGGTKMAMARLTYRLPLAASIDRQLFVLYVQALYLGAFVEAGKAWNEETLDLGGNTKDVGFDVRLKGFTFYNYPIAVSVEGAYGLNDVRYTDPFDRATTFYEGNNWKFYGSVLFSF